MRTLKTFKPFLVCFLGTINKWFPKTYVPMSQIERFAMFTPAFN